MKITSFNPLIVTAKQAEYQKLFEELGFEKRHDKVSGVSEDINTVRMKDPSGFHVDVTNVATMERDMMIIRMNVDDLEEAYRLLSAHGFKAVDGSNSVTSSSKSVLMASPSGFSIDIVKHIKNWQEAGCANPAPQALRCFPRPQFPAEFSAAATGSGARHVFGQPNLVIEGSSDDVIREAVSHPP